MAIKDFKVGSRKDDIRILKLIILLLFVALWLATPPGNKFLQVCFWGHNVQYAVTRMVDKNATEEYKFYWNNAIYLTGFGDKKALSEMNKAVQTAPSYFTEEQMQSVYKERAKIRCSFKDYKGALDDYLKVDKLENDDILRIAFLFKELNKPATALTYCNRLIGIELALDEACACIADVYAHVGKYRTSVKVYNYLITRESDVAEHYIQRAKYKKKLDDKIGVRNDIYLAQLKDEKVKLDVPEITDVMLTKNIKLSKAF